MRNMIKERSLIGLAVIAVLAACGGGGGGGSSTTPGTPSQLPAGTGAVQMSITVPNGSGTVSASRRSPKYVAPGTQSITLTLLQTNGTPVNSAAQGPFNLGAGQPGCVTVTNGVTCTFSVNAPIGDDIFIANTFAQLNGISPLGSGAVALSVVQNTTNVASLTLTGPIQSIVAVSNNSTYSDTLWNGNAPFVPLTYAQASTLYNVSSNARRGAQVLQQTAPILSERLYLIASDVNGNIILNPTTYNQPITLTLNFLNFFGYGASTANVTLSDTPPSGFGSTTSTAVDGGTVQVFTPSDVVMLTLNTNVFSPIIPCFNYYINVQPYVAANFVQVTATLASPPANFSPVPFNLTAEVVPTPTPSPSLEPTPSPSPTGFINVVGS